VVEAPERSGALLFADEALEQGKEIFAVPSNADSVIGAGSNALLKEGAKPVTGGWDILCEIRVRFPEGSMIRENGSFKCRGSEPPQHLRRSKTGGRRAGDGQGIL
jgi:predicted Rossmann fold nucleotide-binding protein DprA/Smf involved in DNA uptake